MDIAKELAGNQTILLLMPGLEYGEITAGLAKQLSKGTVCYFTLNKTFSSLLASFKKQGVKTGNMLFVDAISKSMRAVPDQTEQCYYVSSPGALTELSIVLSKVLRHNFDYIVFDSLTNLLIYQERDPVAKFISNFVNRVGASESKAVFYALKMEQHAELVQECSMFVDKVIDLSGSGPGAKGK